MPGELFARNETVTLRVVTEEDLPFIREMLNDPDVWRVGAAEPYPTTAAETRERYETGIAGTDQVYLMVCDGDQPVGAVATHEIDREHGVVEIGVLIAADHRKQGYASAAVPLFVEYLFDALRVHKVAARALATNDASLAILTDLGFEREGILRAQRYADGQPRDVHYFGVLESEWRTPERDEG